MRVYFAPMEGLTDSYFRRAHHACFSGIDKYFMPFISPSASLRFNVRQEADYSPAQNAGLPVVPQILACNADYFLGMTAVFADAGYTEVNLNLGCPSGTVTGKGKGAAMLKDPDALARFLDAVYARTPIPISIKTRIGFQSASEWPRLLEVLRQYPASEIIVHPRTRQEAYKGTVHRELCGEMARSFSCPVIYNGDIFSAAEAHAFEQAFPGFAGIMVGRGIAADPALGREIKGGNPLDREELRLFHDMLYRMYLKEWPEHAVVGRMHFVMQYMSHCFEQFEKPWKIIKKATVPQDYEEGVSLLFRECPLKSEPHFSGQ